MTFAQVVPVRRMPINRPWLTYLIPDDTYLEAGDLVTIPLQKRQVLGVVWELSDLAPGLANIQKVVNVILDKPLMTPWQRQVCQVLAASGSVSLGDVLYSVLPKISLANYRKIFAAYKASKKIESVSSPAKDEVFWYADRVQAINWLIERASHHRSVSQVVICPTIADIEDLTAQAETHGLTCQTVHSTITPAAYAKICQRARQGEPLLIIGTLRALSLPFTGLPLITLDQEEHPGHKQTAQHPRYDTRDILNQLGRPYAATTSAPTLALYQRRPLTPPATTSNRLLISLNHPEKFNWLSEEMITVVDQALTTPGRVVCIGPRRGYASTSRCRSCGYIQVCPSCGQRVTIFRGTVDDAHCGFCQRKISLQVACPRCHGTDWTVRGLGIEQITSLIKQRWPAASVAPVVNPAVSADIAVDSYQAYHHLRAIKNLSAVIIVSGDSLLNIPDYSTAERAWQYLARIQAEVPATKFLIQTFAPDQPFWQRWLQADATAWYRHELTERQRLSLPPFTVQWIARYRGQPAIFDQVFNSLAAEKRAGWTVTKLPPLKSTINTVWRLLLTFPQQTDAKNFPWLKFFPTPWQLDRHPISWRD